MDAMAAAALGVGVAGLCIPFAGIAAVILGILALRRLRSAPRGEAGRGFAIGGLCIGAVGIGLTGLLAIMSWSMFVTAQQIPAMASSARLAQLHGEMQAYATIHGGYPDHVAALLLEPAIGSNPMRWLSARPGSSDQAEALVGAFDLADWADDQASRDALEAALDALDLSTATYRCADAEIVRLDGPTKDGSIVLAWLELDREVGVVVLTDNGAARFIERRGWQPIWDADAATRVRLGLPALAAPPWPYDD